MEQLLAREVTSAAAAGDEIANQIATEKGLEQIAGSRERKFAMDLEAAEAAGWVQALDPRKPLGQMFKRCMDLEPEAPAFQKPKNTIAANTCFL